MTKIPIKKHQEFFLTAIDIVLDSDSMLVYMNRRFHGRRRHLGSGANTAKFTVNVWEKSGF